MDMILSMCILQNSLPYFSNICRWYTLELSHRCNSNVHLQPNEFFTISSFPRILNYVYCFSEKACRTQQVFMQFVMHLDENTIRFIGLFAKLVVQLSDNTFYNNLIIYFILIFFFHVALSTSTQNEVKMYS